MKYNKNRRFIAFLLFLVILSSIFASETLSRFVTEVNSGDSTRIAYWGINEGPVIMDLFDGEYFNNDDESDIILAKSNDGDNIIAPGLGKESAFAIVTHEDTLTPEVAYELKITLDDTEIDDNVKNNTAIQWKLDNGSWGTFDELKSSLLSLSGDPSGYKIYEPGQLMDNFKKDTVHKIAWQWVDDGTNDVADTALSMNVDFDKTNVNLSITVSAVQYTGTSSMLNATSIFNLNDSNAVLSFRSAAPVGELQEVKIDGATVSSSNYEVIEGSTIIKFNDSYARSLSVGNHIIEIVSQKMTAKTNFKVEDGPVVHGNIIPEGGIYYKGITEEYSMIGDYTGAVIYEAGSEFPKIDIGDVYVYGDYEYRYNMYYNSPFWEEDDDLNGWAVMVFDKNQEEYDDILSNINGKNVVSLAGTFSNCENLEVSPKIPETVKILDNTFVSCTSLMEAPGIPLSVTNMMYTFGETKIVKAPIIPENVKDISIIFSGCEELTGKVIINGNPSYYGAFEFTTKPIELIGKSDLLYEIAGTSTWGNVIVKTIPKGGIYYKGVTSKAVGNYDGATEILTAGDEFPETVNNGDVYVYGDYEYRYNYHFRTSYNWSSNNYDGWGVRVLDTSKTEYDDILTNINGKDIVSLAGAFVYCREAESFPFIPDTVIDLTSAYGSTDKLTTLPIIPENVKYIADLVGGCINLTGNVTILSTNVEDYEVAFSGTVKPITLSGTCPQLAQIAATAENGNVTVE